MVQRVLTDHSTLHTSHRQVCNPSGKPMVQRVPITLLYIRSIATFVIVGVVILWYSVSLPITQPSADRPVCTHSGNPVVPTGIELFFTHSCSSEISREQCFILRKILVPGIS